MVIILERCFAYAYGQRATTFAEKWKRRENQLAYLWDMHKFKENEQIRARFRGSHTIDSVTKDIVKWNRLSTIKRRYLIEIPLTAFGVALIIGIFYLFLVIAQNESVQNSDTYTYSLTPNYLSLIYTMKILVLLRVLQMVC